MKKKDVTDGELQADDVRERIIAATSRLVTAGGRDAATTRAVAAAASVQAPTIYRLFGDKRGLLDAVAAHGLSDYLSRKSTRELHPDPVQDLRIGWDAHVAFGLAHPALFAIINGDPCPHSRPSAAKAGLGILRQKIQRVALAGRLRVGEERAVNLLQSACVGTVLTLLSGPAEKRDFGLSEAAREAVMAVIATEKFPASSPEAAATAATLRALLDGLTVLSNGERHLLEELLDRIANGGGGHLPTSSSSAPPAPRA